MYLEVQKSSAIMFSSWLANWLSQYVSKISEDVRQSDATFLYILATSPLSEADGRVQRNAGVIEIGHGTDPAGPPDGKNVSFLDLASHMTRLLAQGQRY
ncbi:MAG: hypothetical protein ACRDJG_09385 [Actinomycetota bacterium]